MKKISYFFGILLITGILGCDALNNIKTIDLSGNIKKSFDVNITESDSLTVAQTFLVDAASNADVSQYLNKIQKYTVKKVTYVVKSYSGTPGVTLSGQFNFGSISQSITNLDLQAAALAQTVNEMQFDQIALDAIAADLKDGNSIAGSLEGTVSNKPVAFTIEVTFDVDFRAEVL